MSRKETAKRYAVLLLGLSVMALAVSVISKAGLGISPVQSLAYVMYNRFPEHITLGTAVFCWNCIMVLLQWPILRRFGLKQIIQIPLSVFLGLLVDATSMAISPITVHSFVGRIIMLVIGIVILTLSISIIVSANVVMNVGEALIDAIAKRVNRSFAFIKEVFDIFLVSLSVILCFVFFGEWKFNIIGIGTVCSALFTGMLVKLADKAVRPVVEKICKDGKNKDEKRIFGRR